MKFKYNGQWVDVNIKALDSMEIGSIIAFAGDTIPTGWLVCDGSSITQSAYPELYALIGGTLPNFKGRTLVGKDSTDTDFDTLLETGGEKAVQLTTDNLASNIINTSTTGSNSDGYIMRGGYTATGIYNIGGSGVAHNNLQPYAVINWIIKATNTTPTMASVVNAHSTSTTDAYSCDYVNNLVIGNHNDSDIGFVKLPGNIAICYGLYNPSTTIKIPAGSYASVDISLPIPMVANSYSIQLTKYAGGNNYSNVMENAQQLGANNFKINLWNNAQVQAEIVGYNWIAIGKYQ